MIRLEAILKSVITNIDYTFYIKSVEAIAGGYRLHTCDTMHLRKDKDVTINGNGFTISKVGLNQYVEVPNTHVIPLTLKTFTTYPLNFFNGTLKNTMQETASIQENGQVIEPFCWLQEPFTINYGDYDSYSADADVTLFLLDKCLPVGNGIKWGEAWYTNEHKKEVIEPMQNIWDKRILPAIEKNTRLFDDIESHSVRGWVMIGTEDENGGVEGLFNDNFSGVEVRITPLRMVKEACECLQSTI